MSTTPTYDALDVDRRLAIERLLFERLTGSPYAERTTETDASDRKKECLVSCIRDASHREQAGSIPPQQINPTREFSARRTHKTGRVELVTPEDLRETALETMAKVAERLPHDLDYPDRADAETPIPRKRIAAKALGALGYEPVKERRGTGYLAFGKSLPNGEAYSCDLDFGTWRRSVMAIFAYSAQGCRITLPVRSSASGREAPLVPREDHAEHLLRCEGTGRGADHVIAAPRHNRTVAKMARITLRVQPGASRESVVGKTGDEWKIAITAPPIEGRANKACTAFLAKLLGRPKRDVELVGGAKSRSKTFEIAGVSHEEIEARLMDSVR